MGAYLRTHLPLWHRNRGINDLGNLAPRSGIVRPETPVRIPRDHTPAISGLHKVVEGVARVYIVKVRSSARIDRPPLRQHHNLTKLCPRHVGARPERPVRVPSYHPVIE